MHALYFTSSAVLYLMPMVMAWSLPSWLSSVLTVHSKINSFKWSFKRYHHDIASLKTPMVKKLLNLDKKFAKLTIKDSIVRDLKLNCRLLYCTGISNIYMWGHWFIVNFYGNIVDNFVRAGNCGHSSVFVGRIYGHTKCALIPYKRKYSTPLSVENKAQCSTLWKIEHTFPLWTCMVSYVNHWKFCFKLLIQ